MNCNKCNAEINEGAKFCPNCGNSLLVSSEPKNSTAGKGFVASLVMSAVSFILTTIIRFNVHEKADLTPSALSYHWGMVVPSDIKPFVLAVPVFFALITIVKTILSLTMSKNEKTVSCVVAAFSLVASIAIVNWSFNI